MLHRIVQSLISVIGYLGVGGLCCDDVIYECQMMGYDQYRWGDWIWRKEKFNFSFECQLWCPQWSEPKWEIKITITFFFYYIYLCRMYEPKRREYPRNDLRLNIWSQHRDYHNYAIWLDAERNGWMLIHNYAILNLWTTSHQLKNSNVF